MKIAIISDIHSNLEALSKAIKYIKENNIDEVICLGDIVGYGAEPNECIELVRTITSYIVLGNHDEASVNTLQTDSFNPNARTAVYWTSQRLTTENKLFIQKLPLTLERYGILFVHASPLEPQEWNYITKTIEAKFILSKISYPLCFFGHSHVAEIFSQDGKVTNINKGNKYLINVGSIGQPRDGDPRLSFGIFDTETWGYENIRIQYDIKKTADKIINAGLPIILANRLFIGR